MTFCIGVHGFGFDGIKLKNNPQAKLYSIWREMCGKEFYGYCWYSVPLGTSHVWRAWKAGHWNRYYYAWDLALKEGVKLRETIRKYADRHGPVALVAHSLGSRVVLEALNTSEELPVKRLLILSGADSRDHAGKVYHNLRCEVLNTTVSKDGVLEGPGRWMTPKFGAEYIIGRSGLPYDVPCGLKYWHDVKLPMAENHWDAYDERYWVRWRKFLHQGIVE